MKKFLLLTIFALLVTGCGSEKIIGTPEKAVLAFAQIVMTGESSDMQAAGFSETDAAEIRLNVTRAFVDSLKNITPISEATAEQLTNMYFARVKDAVNFKVKTVKDDDARPIVEITATPIDQAETAKTAAAKNDELIALIGMVGKLKSDGATDDQLKENPDVQKLVVSAMTQYIDNIKFGAEKTFSVPCAKITGSDGNVHWAPADSTEFVNFLTGNK